MFGSEDQPRPPKPLTDLEDNAWRLYCDDTAGGMHAADFWHELPKKVQDIYLTRARELQTIREQKSSTGTTFAELFCPPWLAALAIRLEELKARAGVLGLSLDQFEMIVRHVNEEAIVSRKWGTSDQRLEEIGRRILIQA